MNDEARLSITTQLYMDTVTPPTVRLKFTTQYKFSHKLEAENFQDAKKTDAMLKAWCPGNLEL